MGAQSSTSRHQVYSETHKSIIPGLNTFSAIHPPPNLVETHPKRATSSRLGTDWAAEDGDENELIPCVFCWAQGGHDVYLTGSFNNWNLEKKIRLNRSGHDFTTIQNLPRGIHYYKFIVDDQWRYATDQQTHMDPDGNVNNILDIRNFRHYNFNIPTEYHQARQALYCQSLLDSSQFTSDPPTLPILLSKSNCIAAENHQRIAAPLHCISNHIYHHDQAKRKFGPHFSVIAGTIRCREENKKIGAGQKYSTYIYLTTNPLFPLSSHINHGVYNPLQNSIKFDNFDKYKFTHTNTTSMDLKA